MPDWRRTIIAALAVAVSAPAFAADHIDGPAVTKDPATDITDFYAWHTEEGRIVTAITYSPLMYPGDAALYDPDVIYGVHMDIDGDQISDHDIWVRFAAASDGSWGMQVVNLPGAHAPVVGPVNEVVPAPGGWIYAGMRDDPFFMDFDGFNATLKTGDLAFTGVDFFAGANVMAIVLAFDTNAALGDDTVVDLWATTGRI